MPDVITDPQTQDAYTTADPNANAVAPAQVGGQSDNERVLGRQIPSGNIRGDQTITGNLIINDPTTNTTSLTLSGADQSISLGSPSSLVLSAVNQSILIGDSSSPTISISGLTETILVTDPASGLRRIIIGMLPDGTTGLVISKPGIDVYTAFS